MVPLHVLIQIAILGRMLWYWSAFIIVEWLIEEDQIIESLLLLY